MSVSSIEWTDRTWNPVRGCTRVSEGCRHCYAERLSARELPGHNSPTTGEPFARMTKGGPRWTGAVEFLPHKLAEPLSWRKPARVFVNSMSDLFHEALAFEQIAALLGVAAACPHLTFQVLTKRPEVAVKFYRWVSERGAATGDYRLDDPITVVTMHAADLLRGERWEAAIDDSVGDEDGVWPLPNVWLGVSVEDQATADQRIPILLQCPASVRFVSYEPALGPLNFRGGSYGPDWLEGWEVEPVCCGRPGSECCGEPEAQQVQTERLDWIIAGGESGPGARPFDVEWVRETVRQCREAGVPVFVKQLGANVTGPHANGVNATTLRLRDRKGGDPTEWPEDIRIRQFPEVRPCP